MNDYIETNDVKICSDDPVGQFGELFQVKRKLFFAWVLFYSN